MSIQLIEAAVNADEKLQLFRNELGAVTRNLYGDNREAQEAMVRAGKPTQMGLRNQLAWLEKPETLQHDSILRTRPTPEHPNGLPRSEDEAYEYLVSRRAATRKALDSAQAERARLTKTLARYDANAKAAWEALPADLRAKTVAELAVMLAENRSASRYTNEAGEDETTPATHALNT